jgi:ERF superfamily
MPVPTKTTDQPKSDPPAKEEDAEVTPEAYEAARTALIAKLPALADRPTTIYGKLALITGLITQVKKSGRNDFHHYNYAKESDLVEAIRPLLSELGLWIHWTLYSDLEKGFIPHQRLNISRRREGETTEADSLTVICGQFRFIDADGKESLPQITMGYGDDTSDKGLSKAMTAMEKYFLMKTFLVSTGDDPEADTRTDQRAARREQGSAPRVNVTRGSGPTPAAGGRQAEASNPQIKQLGELTRAAGIGSSMDAITIYEKILDPLKVEPLDPDDMAISLRNWLQKRSGPELGRLIHDLRMLVEAKGDKPSTPAETAAPAEAAQPAQPAQEVDFDPAETAGLSANDPDPALVGDDDVE